MSMRRQLRALTRRTAQRVRTPCRGRAALRADMAPSAMQPIFVGGTGRSGTTITSGLIGLHPDYQRLRTEVKFISDRGGLCDLVEGRTTVERFERRLLEKWLDRGEAKGLKVILDQSAIEAALPPLSHGMRIDPHAAAAAFAHRLLDPLAARKDARGWIEMTPSAALKGNTLYRMFPEMKLLHLVRDGRDVACSVLRMPWGPNDLDSALDWWARRLEQGFAACRGLPEDRVLVIQLEDLVVRDRDRQYDRMLSFLGLEDHPRMRSFFEKEMPAEAMHSGRWQTDVPPEARPSFEAHYREIVVRLEERGYPYRADDPMAVALVQP
jgi:Sulfotransferase family